ncbi:MAG TPA: M23 family metallopeptidase [Bacteroidales bacterium]|nr:M23 family metallopeptidase [Bacteroidales bacterium]MDI9534208.1 M23 family metallopeptidase [Bacteroidota bacterium]MBK7732622.1 M23 family metallopeptidase [Bacteroidales bacterium]MBP7036508.1 M23 family metallopeptidase [Bacteroidales bacterium]MBP8710234.1 M23 family metallopeptidase [Bacteroidales bacterium]
MPKTKYKYNHETLSFDRIKLGLRQIFLRFFGYFVASLLLAGIYGFIFAFIFDSPQEKVLKREIAQLTLQYELMNREMENVEKVLTHLQETDDNLYRTIFETEPVPSSYREGGIGGVNRYQELEGFSNSELVIETARRLDRIRKKIYVQSESFDELVAFAMEKEEMLSSIPAIQPLSNKDLKRTASGFGYRIHPIYKISKFHSGMDFTAPTGTEVYATGNGVIRTVKSARRELGNHIIIDHGFGYQTVYAHLDRFNVRVGQKVKRGDVIGFVGSTGLSTAPHLHYEVLANGKHVDPALYYFNDLTPEEYERMLEISSKSGQTFD